MMMILHEPDDGMISILNSSIFLALCYYNNSPLEGTEEEQTYVPIPPIHKSKLDMSVN